MSFDCCASCSAELRVTCPTCGKSVRVVAGKIAPHEVGRCTGSHMEYRSCPGGGKSPQVRYRLKFDHVGGGYKAGEIGVEMANDYSEKYAYKLDFGVVLTREGEFDGPDVPAFLRGIKAWRRVYYFLAHEVERCP